MRLIYMSLVSLLLVGCGGEEYQDLRDFVKNSGADMRGKIEPPPEVKPYEHFAYANDTDLPDPSSRANRRSVPAVAESISPTWIVPRRHWRNSRSKTSRWSGTFIRTKWVMQ